ncbi:hypothetical protein [Candidatus Magnetobacterium casense]|uniref:Uncharacterized protein n=1 Tax=Candidatus Magnetobacterium casense TaxID=1455061 RepID=A0ABS6RWN8_9BACT|nr:hypothetical protein [Candidatus Magnetobacterium casensis]MBV6341040.1 hypothetical protein [Candidatus Magnetobacterium casensis]
MLRCSKCKKKFEEGELNSVIVRDKRGRFVKAVCGACAAQNRPKLNKGYYDKYGFKRVAPWGVDYGDF